MRPKVVDYLNHLFGTQVFVWVIPAPAVIYPLTMLVVLLVYVRRSQAFGLPKHHVLGSAIWGMIGGLVGARLLYLVLHLDLIARDPFIFLDFGGSTISWGAYFGGGLGFTLYLIIHRQPFWHYGDAVVSTLGLGPFVGRFACFLNGCCYGKVTQVPWAVTYPQASYPFSAHVKQGLISQLGSESLPVHPVQLYLALNGLALFLFFSWLWRRRTLQPGALFMLFWATYGATRFSLEFFRGDLNRAFIVGFPDAQVIAFLVCVVSIIAIITLQLSTGLRRSDAENPNSATRTRM
jgi:phosphatidylglycerol:prolipoprotein diacylglycerol transferase